MKRIAVWSMVIAVLWVMGAPAWAHEEAAAASSTDSSKLCAPCAKANDDAASYPAKSGATLLQGAGNVLLGWTEILVEPVRTTQAKGNLGVGVLKGIGVAVKRTVLGVAEVVTFWTPKCHGRYWHFNHDCPICSPKP